MKFESIATALNLRDAPKGNIIAELKAYDLIEVDDNHAQLEWVKGEVLSGLNAGRTGYIRRKWLNQFFADQPQLAVADRSKAAEIVTHYTKEYDAIRYDLGSKAKTWAELNNNHYVDCSGWVYLLAKEILTAYSKATSPNLLYTFSDQQITNCGAITKAIISGRFLNESLFKAGVIVGIDFAEYSWDKGRPLDIDHIVIVGEDQNGLFISQSSSSGGGVNRVPLAKWLASQAALIKAGRVHLVDLLSLP